MTARLAPPELVVEQDGTRTEQRAERIERLPGLEREREPVVGIPDHRHVAADVEHRRDELDHSAERLPVSGRERDTGPASGETRDEEQRRDELLIPRGLLLVDAVRIDLPPHLALEDRTRVVAPLARLGPARPRAARGEDTRGLADQMIVRRRRVSREMPHDETVVQMDRAQPFVAEAAALGTLEQWRRGPSADHVREMPVDQANRDLERAAPVRTSEIRALAHPALEQRADRIEVSAIARQPIRLCERHELEMPIELPQVLDVADEPAVAMIERLAVRERRGNSRQRIGVPLRRKAEREAAPEEREQAPTNVVGNGEIRVGIGRGGGRRNVLDAAGRRPLGGRGVASANEPETLRSETNLPPRARGELVRGHRSRTIQIPLQTLHGPVARNSPPRVPSG